MALRKRKTKAPNVVKRLCYKTFNQSRVFCVTDKITAQSVLFPELFKRPVVVKFDQSNGSSDGGVILLKACDERLGLTERVAGCIEDERQAGKPGQTVQDLVPPRP